MTDLGALPGGTFSMAYDINESGVVVGIAESASHALHGFVWRRGKMTDLGALPGGNISLAYAVDGKGEAAGSALTGSEYHAVVVMGGKWQDLGTLGSDPALAAGLNDRGQIVGASNLDANHRHAFLMENRRMTDLNALISADAGWTLLAAQGINNAGQIVCVARAKEGQPHAVLLTPLPLK